MNTIYKYPKGHPCFGCVHTFEISIPSCSVGADKNKCSLRLNKNQTIDETEEISKIPNNSSSNDVADKIETCIKILKRIKKKNGW